MSCDDSSLRVVSRLLLALRSLASRENPFENVNLSFQNDSPGLSAGQDWSPSFRAFVGGCLVKDPGGRLDTQGALSQPFLDLPRPPLAILTELIARTKGVVRDIDNFQVRTEAGRSSLIGS